ncbi:hypothetical protein F4677DRAFT_417241 [Hypoxylon crocopeplum]|nr:hypothetical protein F4677DRAFT_417241 [Hypoxylon crocopeplum]
MTENMMDGTDVAALQPVSTLVQSPSTYGLTPTGVMPIDHTSCQARKRVRIASSSSSTNYSPSSSSSPSPSRVTKANKSKGSGSKSSFSPLGRSALRKSQTAAAAAVAANTTTTTTVDIAATSLPVAVTSVEPGIFRQQAPETILDLSSSFSYLEDQDLREPRDHYALSPPNFAQTPGLLHGWACNSSQTYPTFQSSTPYSTTQDNSPHEHSSRNYSTDHPGIATYHRIYPSPLPFDTMRVDYPHFPGDGTYVRGRQPTKPNPMCLMRPEGSGMNEARQSGWPNLSGDQPLGDDSIDSHGGLGHVDGLSIDDTHSFLDGTALELGYDMMDDVAADGVRPSSQPEKRSRSCLNKEDRATTGKTRKLKACIRCRMQKIRCKPDPDNEDEECLTCRNINLDSKKVIHRVPCLRMKLAEVVLFREGGLGLTNRWTGVKMKDLGPRDWVGEPPRTIKIIIGFRNVPLEISVKRFKPNSGDVLWKHWVDKNGAKQTFFIEPYALTSIWKTAEQYENYVYRFERDAILEYAENPEVDPLARRTYRAALDHLKKLNKQSLISKGDDVNGAGFLLQYFRLWFTIRNTTGSSFIVGDETLGMKPIDDPDCPYYGTISLPRMIPAQFDSLGHEMLLTQLRKQVLEGLSMMMSSRNPHHFFTIYLTVFMMLQQVSATSADRMRRAKENKDDKKYDLPSFVANVQEGANIILGHWHYYKRDINSVMMETESEGKKKAALGGLGHNESQLIVETRQAYKDLESRHLEPITWEHDLFFASQMFNEGWTPCETFSW